MENLLRLASLAAFLAAIGLAALAVIELGLQFTGHSVIGRAYSAGRLFEFAGIAMVFAIGIQMREQATARG
jgi:hypothetical protein